MINVDTLYQYIDFLAAKDVMGGYLPPDKYNLVLPICVNQIARKYYGPPEQYQAGMPMPQISYEITQLVTDYMSQLKVPLTLAVDNSGFVVKPANYLHKSSVAASWIEVLPNQQLESPDSECECGGGGTVPTAKAELAKKKVRVKWTPVSVVSDQERWAYLQSSLRKPTKAYPICTFIGAGIQFYPEDIKSALLTYIRYPLKAVWAYTLQPDGFPLYNPSGSQDIELPEIVTDELAVTVLNRMGISIREPGLIDWANYVKKTGV